MRNLMHGYNLLRHGNDLSTSENIHCWGSILYSLLKAAAAILMLFFLHFKHVLILKVIYFIFKRTSRIEYACTAVRFLCEVVHLHLI